MIGSVIDNYKIISVLGEGGMGIVYKALDMKLERFVALKILSSQSANNPQFIERFKREARNQAKLTHLNIVPVYGFTDEDNLLGIAMEFVDGETLEKMIYRKKRIEPLEALKILKQILQGVGYAHSKGYIHRDIKPSNIILSKDGFAKIMDFGISKSMFEKGITKTGTKIGTILYMSPEQIRAEEPTRQSDIYSIGITFYEMLIGKTPFDFGTEYEIMEAHLKKHPGRVSVNLDSIPPEIDKIVAKALDKSILKRYSSCDEFLDDIEALIRKLDTSKPEPKRKKPEPGSFQNKAKATVVLTFAIILIIALAYYIFTSLAEFWPKFKSRGQMAADTTAGLVLNEGAAGISSWASLPTAVQSSFNSVGFIDAASGFAVGERGTLLATTDAGLSWQQRPFLDSLSLSDIFFVNENTGFIVGEQGRVFITNSRGEQWTPMPSGTTENLFRVAFHNGRGYIIGSKGTLLRTTPDGTSWMRVPLPTTQLLYGISFSGQAGYIAGWNGTLLRTQNSGDSWEILPPPTERYLKDVFFLSPQTGFICGAGGEFQKTTDGGQTWRKLDSKVYAGLVSVAFLDQKKGFCISNRGDILESSDGGNSWSVNSLGNNASLTRFVVSGEKNALITGINGLILKLK